MGNTVFLLFCCIIDLYGTLVFDGEHSGQVHDVSSFCFVAFVTCMAH